MLLLCPTTVIDNWMREFQRWVGWDVIDLRTGNRRNQLKSWFEKGGVLVMGYEMYREAVYSCTDKAVADAEKAKYLQWLQNPGPHIVVADEAHRIKNQKVCEQVTVSILISTIV